MKPKAILLLAGAALLPACGDPGEHVATADLRLTEVTLEDVGLNDTFSLLSDVNSLGEMVGVYESTSGIHAFRLVDDSFTDIHPSGSTVSWVRAIGASGIAGGYVDQIAAVWSGTNATSIDTLGSSFSTVSEFNSSSEAVGTWQNLTNGPRGFYWSEASGMIDLGALAGGRTTPASINELGQIVGWSTTHPSTMFLTHAISWQNGVLTDLGTLGGESSMAGDANDNGLVVGVAQASDGVWHACTWLDGIIVDLDPTGTEDSAASSVNNSGHIVGYRMIGGQRHATLWRDGGAIDLGAGPGSRAFVVNDLDIITGTRDEALGFVWANPVDGSHDLPAPAGAAPRTTARALGPAMAVGFASPQPLTVIPDARAVLWKLQVAPPAPNEAIDAIDNAITTIPVGSGEASALGAKLNAARHQCAHGNENAATNQIQAFINQVQALIHAGKIAPEDGHDLIALASAVLDNLTCP